MEDCLAGFLSIDSDCVDEVTEALIALKVLGRAIPNPLRFVSEVVLSARFMLELEPCVACEARRMMEDVVLPSRLESGFCEALDSQSKIDRRFSKAQSCLNTLIEPEESAVTMIAPPQAA